MNVFDLAHALVQGAAAMPMDENSLSMLITLIGVAGGVAITGYFRQLKAKTVKADRKPPRKPE